MLRDVAAIVLVLVAIGATPYAQVAPRDSVKIDRKLDSRLLAAIRQRESSATSPALTRNTLDIDVKDRVLVDIRADVTDRLSAAIGKARGMIISSFPKYESVRARIPLSELRRVAAVPDVRFISPAEEPITEAPQRE